MLSSPLVRVETAPTMRIVVDLPAPFGPRSPNDSPGATSKSMPSTAATSLYFLVRAVAVITGAGTRSTLRGGADARRPVRRSVRCGARIPAECATPGNPRETGVTMTQTTTSPRRSMFAPKNDAGPRATFGQLLPYLAEHRGVLAVVVALSILGAGAIPRPAAAGQPGDHRSCRSAEPLGMLVWALVGARRRLRPAQRLPALPAAAHRHVGRALGAPPARAPHAPAADQRVRHPPHRRPRLARRIGHDPAVRRDHPGARRRDRRGAHLRRRAHRHVHDRPGAARAHRAR